MLVWDMPAIRMNELLQEAAAELNVDLESSVMQHVLDTVGTLTTGQTAAELEEKAVSLLQRHTRGWLARKKTLKLCSPSLGFQSVVGKSVLISARLPCIQGTAPGVRLCTGTLSPLKCDDPAYKQC